MAFEGFPKAGVNFFRELAARQDRDWFKAHREEFAELWERPMEALLEEVVPALQKLYRGHAFEKPKVFRIHRDVRFSKDKSPFKTELSAVVALKGGHEAGAPAALYVSLGLEDAAGAGHWVMPPPQLARYRDVVAGDKSGAELAKRVAALEKKGCTVEAFEKLKRVPPGFAPDHPRARLLQLKGLGLTFAPMPAKARFGPGLADWLVERAAEAAPLVLWLEAQLRPGRRGA